MKKTTDCLHPEAVIYWLLCLALGVALLLSSPPVTAQVISTGDCHTVAWIRGKPYDYYARETQEPTGTFRLGLLGHVNRGHFNTNVQSLQRGQTAPLPGDLHFVLNSIPNHPRALDVYSTFEYRYSNLKSFRDSPYTRAPTYQAECFFERATRLYPQYGETWMVWGIHRHRNQDYEGAVAKYREALARGYSRPELHYNLGLSYLELGHWSEADKHERQASAAGYPLKGLRKQLDRARAASNSNTGDTIDD